MKPEPLKRKENIVDKEVNILLKYSLNSNFYWKEDIKSAVEWLKKNK